MRFLVLDEADRMVETGHFKELDSLLTLLTPTVKRQTFVLSATLTAQHRNFVPVSTCAAPSLSQGSVLCVRVVCARFVCARFVCVCVCVSCVGTRLVLSRL